MARALRELFAIFSTKVEGIQKLVNANKTIDKTAKVAKKADSQLDKLIAGFSKFGLVIGGAAIAGGLQNFVMGVIAVGDQLDKVSKQIGLTTRQYQELQHAANLSGVNTQELANALGQLQRRANDAATGSSEAMDSFRQLGIDIKDANGELLPADELLKRVADGLQNTSNSSERTALSMELMGRNGRKLLPMLADGRVGIERMAAELEELGGGMSQEAIDRSVELNDTIARMKLSMQSFSSVMAVWLFPKLDWLIKVTTKGIVAFGKLTEKSNLIQGVLITLGSIMAAFAISTIGVWGPLVLAAAAIAVIVLAVDELITAFQGGDTLLTDFIDSIGLLFDLGPIGTQFFTGLREGFDTIWNKMKEGKSFTEALQMAVLQLWDSGEKGQQFLAVVLGVLGAAIEGAQAYIGFLWNTWWPGIAGVVDAVIGAFQSYAGFLWNTWWPMISGVIDAVIGAFRSYWSFLTDTWWPGISGIFTSVIDGIKNVLQWVSKITGISDAVGRVGEFLGVGGSGQTTRTTTSTGNQTAIAQAPQRPGANVNAGITVGNITVNEATDANAVQRRIDQTLQNATQRQARELQSALVSS